MTVDAERLVSSWLRAQDEVTDLVGQRVYTDLPRQATYPLVRLTLIGGGPAFNRPLHLDEAVLQFDCYGGPKVTARLITDTVRSLLSEEIVGAHEGGVVTGVTFGQLYYLPDVGFDPARPRYVFEASVYTHP